MKHDMVIGHYSSSGCVGTKSEFFKIPTIQFEYDKAALDALNKPEQKSFREEYEYKPPEKEIDPVNKPEHYQYSPIQPIDVIDAWELDFYLGSVIKYIARFKKKGKPLEDLRKAKFYLDKKIEEMEKKCTM